MTSPGESVLFTADSAKVYVIRDVLVESTQIGGGAFRVFIRLPGVTDIQLLNEVDWPAPRPLRWEGRQVLEPGEQLVATSSLGFWVALATGYALSL